MIVLILINTTIFSLLAILHFYWAFGGKRFLYGTLPTYPTGQFLFRPKFMTTLFVAVALVAFALITFGNTGSFDTVINERYIKFGTYGICLMFLLRAIGDFNFIGFGKKIKGTSFASKDTKFYSPFCLFISLNSFIIAI